MSILDNYATHKHPKGRAWLERHDRWTFHYTPTSGSWLNAVEGFFRQDPPPPPRGVFRSLVDLQAAIHRDLAEHNARPQALRLDRRARENHGQAGAGECVGALEQSVDFARLRELAPVKLFLSATNVRTGKVKIFANRRSRPRR